MFTASDQSLHHTPKTLYPSWLGAVCANLGSADHRVSYGLVPHHGTQPELIFRIAAVFDFLVDTFFSLSPAYFSLDLTEQQHHLYLLSSSLR